MIHPHNIASTLRLKKKQFPQLSDYQIQLNRGSDKPKPKPKPTHIGGFPPSGSTMHFGRFLESIPFQPTPIKAPYPPTSLPNRHAKGVICRRQTNAKIILAKWVQKTRKSLRGQKRLEQIRISWSKNKRVIS